MATSLAMFVVVYFLVFGVGIWLILRLMGTPPHPAQEGAAAGEPIRTAGITPAPALPAGHQQREPAG